MTEVRRPSDSPSEALNALTDAVQALESVGVTAWLTDGTLLGAVRDRGFIAHDADMDLGAMVNEYHPRVVPALKRAGFTVRKTHGTKQRGLEHRLKRDGFRLDIFWHYDTPGGGVWHAAWLRGEMLRYDYQSLTLAPLHFMERTFWAPSPPKLHLVTKYGPAWRTPVTDWDWAYGPANVRRTA